MALRPVTDALGAWVTTPQRGHRPALDHPCGRACVACMHGSDRDGDPDLACTPRMADSGRPAADPSDARRGPGSTLTPAAAPSRAPALARPRPLRHSPGAYLQRNGAPRSGSPGWAPLPRGRHGKKYMPADAVGKACTARALPAPRRANGGLGWPTAGGPDRAEGGESPNGAYRRRRTTASREHPSRRRVPRAQAATPWAGGVLVLAGLRLLDEAWVGALSWWQRPAPHPSAARAAARIAARSGSCSA
jgi:hypothetical protein